MLQHPFSSRACEEAQPTLRPFYIDVNLEISLRCREAGRDRQILGRPRRADVNVGGAIRSKTCMECLHRRTA